MQITIKYNDSEIYLKKRVLLWKELTKPSYKYILFLISFATICFVVEVFGSYTFYSEVGGSAYYDFHISLGIGIGMALWAIIYSYHLFKAKKNYLLLSESFIRRAKAIGNLESTLLITGETIKQIDFEEMYEARWEKFPYFKIQNGFIFLLVAKNTPSSIVIEMAKMSNLEQNQLLEFLKNKK